MTVTKFLNAFEARCGSGYLLNKMNHQPGIRVDDEWMMFRKKGYADHRAQWIHVPRFFDKHKADKALGLT